MSFLNPYFLLGLLTAAVPVLLHLIKREHARKMEFPTLMFLRRISKRTIRYQKLRHLLLLLLRVLAFVLLALAFSRPYLEKGRAAASIGRVASVHVLALDNSMSMGYGDRWDRARKAAADIVRSLEPGDRVAVLEFSDRAAAKMEPTTDSSRALAEIEDGMKLTDQATHYGQALKAAERIALDAGTGRRVIHWISDFQKNGWAAEDRESRLGAGIELLPLDVGSDEFSNLAFRDVNVTGPDEGAGGGVNLKASVTCFGTRDRTNVRMSLNVDGRRVSERRVDVPRGKSRGIEFPLPGQAAGVHSVTLEIEDPDLTADNRFYLTVEARTKIPVSVVENATARRQRPPSFFLAKALNVETLSPYRLTVVPPQSTPPPGGLVVWNNAPGGSAETQRKLRDFVRAGGGVAVVLADSSQSADFNRAFGAWLPVRIASSSGEGRRRARPAEDYVLMTDIRMDHPIFRPFNKPYSGIFSSARFFDHARLEAGPGAEVVARFDNGDPALVSINLEKGRVLIFASSADDASNDLPLKAVYAPFWQQMLRYLEDYRDRRNSLNVGETISPGKFVVETAARRALGGIDENEPVVVLDPGKQRLPLGRGADTIVLDRAGFYEVRTAGLSAAVAVNTPPRESDLSHGNAEEMAAGFLSSAPGVTGPEEVLSPAEQDRRQRIWMLLLIAALLFLISELALSNLQVASGDSRSEADDRAGRQR
jgi:hypothetical protein